VRCDRDSRYTSLATWCFLTRSSLNIHQAQDLSCIVSLLIFDRWIFKQKARSESLAQRQWKGIGERNETDIRPLPPHLQSRSIRQAMPVFVLARN
jgi:hypothetical protein